MEESLCKEIGDSLVDWVEGELTGAAQARIGAHLQDCLSCEAEVRRIQTLTGQIGQLPEVQPPRGVEARVMARIRGAGKTASASAAGTGGLAAWLSQLFSSPALVIPALAAVLLVAGSVFFLSTTGSGSRDVQTASVPSGVRLQVSAGEATVSGQPGTDGVEIGEGALLTVSDSFKGKLLYPDGTWVRVRPGAELRVFRTSLALNVGGVWLRVKKGGTGFRVETPQAVVAVRGTVFGVEYDRVASETSVHVEEGSVEVSTDEDSLLLEAGQGARVKLDLKVEPMGFGKVFGLDREDFKGKLRRGGVPIDDLNVEGNP